MAAILRYRLDAQGSYAAGKPVIIGFTLENLSSDELWILNWYTPLEGVKGKIFTVLCDGEEARYSGRMVKRGEPGPREYLRLPGNGSLHAEIDLSMHFDLRPCGKCTVRFTGEILDVVGDELLVRRRGGPHARAQVPGNEVTFAITGPGTAERP